MPDAIRRQSPSKVTDDVLLSWTVHLARRHPARLVVSLVIAMLACCAGYYALGFLGAAATTFVMAASLADFLFPVRYAITSSGASCRMALKQSTISWEKVRRCYLDDSGVKLSPLPRPSRLEAFRGVYLRFADNEDDVIEAVRSMRRSQCTE